MVSDLDELRIKAMSMLSLYDSVVDDMNRDSSPDDILSDIEELFPNSDFSDLMFYGEKERNNKELIDEAILREIEWRKGGALAVYKMIMNNMKDFMENSEVKDIYFKNAEMKFREMENRISSLN